MNKWKYSKLKYNAGYIIYNPKLNAGDEKIVKTKEEAIELRNKLNKCKDEEQHEQWKTKQ